MDSKQPIIIAYSGSLKYFGGETAAPKSTFFFFFNDNVNYNTRSCFYTFKAIAKLKGEGLLNPSDLHLHLWGDIDSRNKDLAKQLDIEEFVTISGFCPKQESVERLKQADVLFLPLESSKRGQKPLFIPGKIFDYLLVGKPVLGLMEESDCRDILQRAGLGIFAHPSKVDEIAEALLYIVRNGEKLPELHRPDETYIQSFRMEKKTAELASIFNKVLSKP